MKDNDSLLTEEQLKKRQKILSKFEKEIKCLEKEIKYAKYKNIKIGSIRNLKIFAKALEAIFPYVLTAGIVVGGFSILNATPFVRDDIEQPLNIKKTYDSYGNSSYASQYAEFKGEYNKLYYYEKWSENEEGFYVRTIKTYKLDKITEEEVLEILEKKIFSLEDILGEPQITTVEKRKDIPEEEKTNNDFLMATIYDVDKNDIILVKEDINDNIAFTLLCVFMSIVLQLVPAAIRYSSGYDFSKNIREIIEKQKMVSVEELNKVLTLKRENYDRLTRK